MRYVDDVKANLDNLVILMADQINLDKIAMREQTAASLERLLTQNYIGRAGDVYSFLTDEEQDIQRDIYRNTAVDTASIVSKIGSILFGDIYTARKYRYDCIYDFPIDTMVDRIAVGTPTGGMKVQKYVRQKNMTQLPRPYRTSSKAIRKKRGNTKQRQEQSSSTPSKTPHSTSTENTCR